MKKWKQQIVDEIVRRAEDLKEVSLRDVANDMGYNHIKTEDCLHIARAVEKCLPEYRPLKLISHSYDSLFVSLVFTTLEYQTEADWLEEVGE